MKDLKKPQSKEKKIALGFTVAVHVVAISGLLFLGLAQPYEPPKSIKTVLIKPEDLILGSVLDLIVYLQKILSPA